MALKKLSLRRKADTNQPSQEEGQVADTAPKKLTLRKSEQQKIQHKPEAEVEVETEAEVEVQEELPLEYEPIKKPVAKFKKPLTPTPAPAPVDVDLVDPDEDRSQMIVVPMVQPTLGAITGEINERDLMRPRIQLVQNNSSDLEEKGFSVGQIVLNSEILIWEKGFDPLNVILIAGRKKFVQRLTDDEYKSDIVPMVFDSAQDAQEAGFETNWQDNEPPEVDPALYCLFLLEQPEFIDPDPIFSLEHNERKFTIAEMKLGGVNYRSSSSGRWLMTQSRSSLIPDTRSFTLAMTCTREKQVKSGNIVTVAKFKNLGKHEDQSFDEWIKSLA